MTDLNGLIDVLILEDNQGDYILVEDFLLEKFKRITISHYRSLKECSEKFIPTKKFSIILLDLILIDLQKEVLLEQVQSKFENTPIIVLTGYTDIELARNMLAKGASDFLLKDEINPEILYKTIVYALERESFISGLNSSKIQYQNLFNFNPQPMWLFNRENLRFLDVNNAAIEKYGYTLDEFLQMTISDIRPKEEIPLMKNSINEKRTEKSSTFAGVFTHIKKSGEFMKVEIFRRDIDYNNQRARIVSVNDITEKLTYIELIELKNKNLKEIAWKQSHVVRAPLSRMMGIINLIGDSSFDSEDLPYLLKNLQISAKELDQIIAEIVIQTQSLNIQENII
jgi:PAS domain S-box-containing protein